MGLGTVGLGLLVGPSLGQQQQTAESAGRPAHVAATPTAPVAPVIGTIDMDAVFKNYEKVKVSSEEFKAAALARKADLQKIQDEAQQEAEILAKLHARHRGFQEAREQGHRAQGPVRGRTRAGRARLRRP